MFADTEVVSLVNLVKMRLGMFTVFCLLQPDLGELGVNPTKKLSGEENSGGPAQGQL